MNDGLVLIEQTVLGLICSYWDDYKHYIPQLKETDFVYYSPLFCFLQKAYKSDKKYDSVLLGSDAIANGLKDSYIACTSNICTRLDINAYIDELMDSAVKRRLRARVLQLYQSTEITLDDLKNIIEEEKNNGSFLNEGEKALRRIAEYTSNLGKKEPRIYTGFSIMDKVLGGFRPGTVCHIGARPSTGKTTFAINIAQRQVHKKVLFFSLEMSSEMIFDRYASNFAEIDYSLFTSQELAGEDIEKIKNLFSFVESRKNFFVLDDVYNIESIVSATLKIKPDLVVIDYIQKVGTLKKIPVMRERIEHISGELKKLAKESGSVIICLSQLSRDGQDAPTMSNLKESGALEADGDYIIILHRPFVLEKRVDINPEETDVLIDKNKFGETGIIKMMFKGKYQRFLEVDQRYCESLEDV